MRRVVGLAASADRSGVGIELEGIEGGKFGGVFGNVGRQAGDDAGVRLDGDEFAAALAFNHRVVDDIAGGEARGRHLDAILFLS